MDEGAPRFELEGWNANELENETSRDAEIEIKLSIEGFPILKLKRDRTQGDADECAFSLTRAGCLAFVELNSPVSAPTPYQVSNS